MFFPEKIISIKPSDRVLEVGPGATPFSRSDVFLELNFNNEKERIAQSGNVGILKTDKPVIFYEGGVFPFDNLEFDYVICSHVLEHVENPESFLSEIQRVGKKGYMEFPTIYYDYLYNIPEHQNLLFEKSGIIYWMKKTQSGLNKYSQVQFFFNISLQLSYYDTIVNFKGYFFQGFEWDQTIESKQTNDLNFLTFSETDIKLSPNNFNIAEKLYPQLSFKKFLHYKLMKKWRKFFRIN